MAQGNAIALMQPDDALAPELREPPSKEAIEDALRTVIGKLGKLALQQVTQKAQIEERWQDDLRHYHGQYDRKTAQKLFAAENEKSKLFVGLTRAKTAAWEARLSDLLYPTDDKNWGVAPTPVPELADAAKRAVDTASGAAQQATSVHQAGQPDQAAQIAAVGSSAAEVAGQLQDQMSEAERRAALMEAEMDAQLRDCNYNVRSRENIHDLVKLGTGIMKGPVVGQRTKRSWQQTASAGSNVWSLTNCSDPKPEFLRVDPWSFFPDMTATNPDAASFTFERHLWNEKQLRDAVKTVGLDPDEVGELVKEKPKEGLPPYWPILRQIAGDSTSAGSAEQNRFWVWEYHGALERDDLEAIAQASGDKQLMLDLEASPLAELSVILWFCQDRLLKFGPHPMDSGDSLYSVVPFERDDTSMFGYGVPFLMRDSQKALNAAWRMTMDNGALSVGPQIVIDTEAIKPVAGESYDLKSMKVWLMSGTSMTRPEGFEPFQVFEIPSRQDQLQAIITLARQFADDESGMPMIAEGQQASHVTQTANGMSMLMNSGTVIFRRVVKNYDDFITTPNIRRLYDWNMQFNARDDLKGDMNVDARGSSVLLVRELQGQNIMAMIRDFAGHPVLGPMGKWADAFRKLVNTWMLHADDFVKTDTQIQQEAQAAAQSAQNAPQGKDPAEIQAEVEIANIRAKSATDVANINQETQMMITAANHNMTLDELQTKLQINRDNIGHKERTFAAAAAVEPKGQHVPAENL